VRLAEASPLTGGLMLDLVGLEDGPLPQGGRKGGRYAPRKPVSAGVKAAKTARKVHRKRR
jgi:ribonuclease R